MDAQPKIGGFGCFKGVLQIRRDEWYFLISRPNFGRDWDGQAERRPYSSCFPHLHQTEGVRLGQGGSNIATCRGTRDLIVRLKLFKRRDPVLVLFLALLFLADLFLFLLLDANPLIVAWGWCAATTTTTTATATATAALVVAAATAGSAARSDRTAATAGAARASPLTEVATPWASRRPVL